MDNNHPTPLLENDAEFQDIVMSMSGLVWEIDTNGVVTYISNNIEKILGYTPKEIIGKTIYDFMTPKEAKRIRGVYADFSLKKGLMIDYENCALHKDGTKVFFLTNGVPILDKNGDLVGFRGVGKDITQLKVAKDHYQNLFDTIPVGLYYTKPDGQILDANPRLVQLLGYTSKESLIATNAAQFYCDLESRRQWQELMETEGVVHDFETWFRRFDGSLILVRNTSRAIKDDDGQVLFYEGVLEDISERKKIEEKLQRSEKRYRELYQSSRDAIAATDKNGFIIECNQAYANMLGYSLEELKDIRYQDITPSKWHTLDRDMTEQTKTRGYSNEFEKEFIRKDGTVFPVSMRVWRIDDETDDSIGSWVIVRDITERKKAESEILENEKKFRTLFNETPIGLLTSDIHGNILSTNKAVLEILGSPSEEATKGINLLTFPLLKDIGYSDNFKTCMESRGNISAECLYTSKWGKAAYIRYKLVPLIDESDTVYGVLSGFEDISERKIAELLLKEERAQLLSIFDSIDEIIYVIDIETDEILFSNRYLRDFVGKDPSYSKCYSILHGFDRICDFCPRNKVIELKGEPYRWEFTSHSLKRDFIIFMRIIKWPDGRDVLFTMGIDITERRTAEKNILSERNRAMLYLDVMGHDFCNHLQVISASAALLGEQMKETNQRYIIKQIEDSCQKCTEMIQKVQVTEQLMSISLVETSLDEELKACLKAFSSSHKDIIIETSFDVDRVLVSADKFLYHLFCNILMNAAEHNTSDKPHIWVNLCERDSGFVVSIADNGPGIPDDTKKILFDMTRRYGGVGLHQSYQIINKYGGRIEVHDRIHGNPSQGVEFRLWFPRVSELLGDSDL